LELADEMVLDTIAEKCKGSSPLSCTNKQKGCLYMEMQKEEISLDDKYKYWSKLEKKIPGVKNEFELCIVGLKLCNYDEAFTHINFGHSSKKEPLMRCHIFTKKHFKVFTFYYNTSTNEMHVRNTLDSVGRLKRSGVKVEVKSIKQLQELLQKLIVLL
jgi:hypothetical protein